jgi:hypothetical protein
MKIYRNLWEYLAEFLLDWETFHTKAAKKIKTYVLWSIFFLPENNAG